jgi:hypothetical protein
MRKILGNACGKALIGVPPPTMIIEDIELNGLERSKE